jgi:hypothetical protein
MILITVLPPLFINKQRKCFHPARATKLPQVLKGWLSARRSFPSRERSQIRFPSQMRSFNKGLNSAVFPHKKHFFRHSDNEVPTRMSVEQRLIGYPKQRWSVIDANDAWSDKPANYSYASTPTGIVLSRLSHIFPCAVFLSGVVYNLQSELRNSLC